MSETFDKSNPLTSEALPNATSLRALGVGATPYGKLVGRTTEKCGQAVAPVNPSAQAASAVASQTKDICGPLGSDSLMPSDPQSSSGSKSLLRMCSEELSRRLAEALMPVVEQSGSTLFRLTWKRHTTPSERRIFRLRTSGLRTSGKDCTSWRSPTERDFHPSKHNAEREDSQVQLAHQAQWAAWPTPNTPTGGPNSESSEKHTGGMDLDGAAKLATWAMPRSTDGEKGGPNQRGSKGDLMLRSQAAMTSWATPSSRDFKDSPGMAETGTNPDGSERTRLDQLPRQALLTDSGQTVNGSPAVTIGGGQLNASFSRWLMGLPPSWDIAALRIAGNFRRLSKKAAIESAG